MKIFRMWRSEADAFQVFNTIQLLEQFYKIDSIGVIRIYILSQKADFPCPVVTKPGCFFQDILGASANFGTPCQRDNTEGTVIVAAFGDCKMSLEGGEI